MVNHPSYPKKEGTPFEIPTEEIRLLVEYIYSMFIIGIYVFTALYIFILQHLF